VVGNRTKVKVVKNKVASPFREARIRHHLRRRRFEGRRPARLGRGAERGGKERLLVQLQGRAHRPGQGNARQFLKDNADIRLAIDSELRKLLGLVKTEGAEGAPSPMRNRRERSPFRRGSNCVGWLAHSNSSHR